MNIIGLKKCPNCGFKELYGCHNYYTTGAPFICPKCKTEMEYAPYKMNQGHISDEEWQKTLSLLEKNLKTLDFSFVEKKTKEGIFTLKWTGINL